MKKLLLVCLLPFLGFHAFVQAQDPTGEIEIIQDEVKQIEALIQATQESLGRLENIKKIVTDLKNLERLCMKNPKDAKLLYKLAQAGHAAYAAIQEANLEDFFRDEFLEELKKLANLADKKTTPPAR